MKLLLVEDDIDILHETEAYFKQNFSVLCATSLTQAKSILRTVKPDAAILDLMLPDGNGMTLLNEKFLVCPTIILTTVVSDDCILQGLDAGAEDYVVKPCSLAVLAKRLERRLPKENAELKFDALTINPVKRTTSWRGIPIRLTSAEFNILYFLASHENEAFTVTEIYEAVWEMPALGTQTCKIHLYYLRRKLEETTNEKFIVTDFGKGYRFCGGGMKNETLE